MRLQTEFPFTLPLGYVDSNGEAHKKGVMRLATAIDEIAPLRDPRVKNNSAYLSIILLARVVTKIGTVESINTGVIETLFSADLAFLQDFYRRINETGSAALHVTCPQCAAEFDVEPTAMGAIVGYPLDQLHEEVAYIAYHFHWPLGQIMRLEHADRRRWVEEISKINQRLNGEEAQAETDWSFLEQFKAAE